MADVAAPTEPQGYEQFRAALECREDPCPLCGGAPAHRVLLNNGGYFPTPEGAREYGDGRAVHWDRSDAADPRHRVIVQRRHVTRWADLPETNEES